AGGQVPVAGPVNLLDPGPQPGDRFRTVGGCQLPPRRCRPGAVTAGVGVGLAGRGEVGERGSVLSYDAAEGGGLVGELGQPAADRGAMLILAALESGGRARRQAGFFHARGRRAMTGAQPPRMTRANPAGSCRIMSGVATSWRVAWSWPRTVHDACPHSVLAACSVLTSVMPGRNTFTEEVSST